MFGIQSESTGTSSRLRLIWIIGGPAAKPDISFISETPWIC